ncbi:uncharacterized protein EI97DRAFT_455575 [Westerdykella ornata]|uniref:Uncharacterized protein n=1 Tax=Westerdykella ornata TaxID=318751 RepID=A0A6A6JSU3_WESOR|nr:uncharacterized protein EI97DRAFT_455575 [Westerdykella ornata]KAF2279314.1 hypothetical protein EI97DRAFT_455575 [Westerdykella ornata]
MAWDVATSGHGRTIPRSKSIKLAMQFATEPVFVATCLRNGRYVALACRIKIDFSKARVTVQVPFHDWMKKAEMKDLRDAVLENMRNREEGLEVHIATDDSVMSLLLDLLPRAGSEKFENWSGVALVGEVLARASSNMPKRDFEEVVRSVIEVRDALTRP